MTQRLRLGLVGLNQTPLDWNGNQQRIRAAWHEARRLGARLLLFPELAVSGYGCEDAFLHPDTGRRAFRIVRELATESGDEVLILGFPWWFGEDLYNAVAVINRGAIRGLALKSHLAREGIHYEPRWFRAWPKGQRATFDLDGTAIPVGALGFQAAGLNFALEICEDAWVKQEWRPCGLIRGAQWVFNASASHFSLRKADVRERIVRESSRIFGVGYAYANLVGCESGRAIYDGELLVAEGGEIVNRSGRLYMEDYRVLAHDIHYRAAAEGVDVGLSLSPDQGALPDISPHRDRQATERDHEFAKAASLALFDYMRKSRSRGFTLSLSGGVDSGAVAVLVWVLAHRLLEHLALEDRRTKLAYFAELDVGVTDPRALVSQLLRTVYQATRNSGSITRTAAASLAQALGAQHLELDVDSLVEGYKSQIAAAIGRELDWTRDDIVLQNIQARVRGPSVWMLANLSRSLLLSTSNRSEVAVGYATMDGDTCGGLAPIAGVEKSFLRSWMLRMEKQGLPGFPPIPELRLINEQQPTAELRPPEQAQADEKDLMPYRILDALEEALIARRKTPVEAFETVNAQHGADFTAEQIYRWTRKFCRMFAMSQWKRERYAPAFHLDDRNLDPKTWARYPILSGAFEVELEELDRHYARR